MKINKYAAQSIVDSMKEIINYDINFIDNNGVILASTDEHRIGQEHYGAKICIHNKEDLFIYSDDLYKGSKKGINMLLYFENEIIGVIGITGEPDVIDKYGRIIKKMSEILIYEDWYKTNKMKMKENVRISIEGLLLDNKSAGPSLYPENDISEKSIITIIWEKDSIDSVRLDKVYNKIMSLINIDNNNYIAQFYNEIVVIISAINEDELSYLVHKIYETIKVYGTFSIGVGSSYRNEIDLKKSYDESKASLKWNSISSSSTSIAFYEKLDLGLLFNNTTKTDIKIYINSITKNIPEKDIALYLELIQSYSKHNGKIKEIGEELYIHKNTVQYRLNRLYEITGYNPRNITDFVKLYLAFSMMELDD